MGAMLALSHKALATFYTPLQNLHLIIERARTGRSIDRSRRGGDDDAPPCTRAACDAVSYTSPYGYPLNWEYLAVWSITNVSPRPLERRGQSAFL